MNKAFMKEPEAPAPRCPTPRGCGSLGTPVSEATVAAQLSPEAGQEFSGAVFYCANPGCPVGYFDNWGRTVLAESLRAAAWPKDPEAPICSCLGIAAERIIEDALEGRRDTVLKINEQARRDDAPCETRSPEGCSCETRVRRLFLQNFSETSGE
jgi:hypothetical protein